MHASLKTWFTLAIGLRFGAMMAAGALVVLQFVGVFNAYDQQVVPAATASLHAAEPRSAFQVQHQQLKDVLLRGADPASFTKYTGAFDAANADVAARETALRTELATMRVLASAQELGAVAAQLDALVGRFRLDRPSRGRGRTEIPNEPGRTPTAIGRRAA